MKAWLAGGSWHNLYQWIHFKRKVPMVWFSYCVVKKSHFLYQASSDFVSYRALSDISVSVYINNMPKNSNY